MFVIGLKLFNLSCQNTYGALCIQQFISCGRESWGRPGCGLECISVGVVIIFLSSVELLSISLLREFISNSNCWLELVSRHKSSLHLVRSEQGMSLSSAGCRENVFNLFEELTQIDCFECCLKVE